jgi:AraC-like DNA-binding protein
VQLGRYLPSATLEHLVEKFWTVRWDLRGQSPFTPETLPYPSVHVVLENGQWTITGVTTRFVRTLVEVGMVFGIKFKPGGFRPFIGSSVAELTNRTAPAGQWLPLAAELPTDETWSDARLIECAEAALCRYLPEPDPRVEQVCRLVSAIERDRSIVRVEQLVALDGLSVRGLQRLFREYVGVSPKWVIQRYRLFEAAERLTAGGCDGAQVAQELGYFDQAHFIRDFKAMVGRSPRAFVTQLAGTSGGAPSSSSRYSSPESSS